MSRRVSLPGASELFRSTQYEQERAAGQQDEVEEQARAEVTELKPSPSTSTEPQVRERKQRGTGRVRHEEKITVYVSSDELIALETARLRMRAEFGSGVDRGRIVREAVSIAMDDLAAHGAGSELVKRLSAT